MESFTKEIKIQVTDFIGDLGVYQISLILVTFTRYILVAMMVNVGPLIAPEVEFWCEIPMPELMTMMPNLTQIKGITQQTSAISNILKNNCEINFNPQQQLQLQNSSVPINDNNNLYQCFNWTYDEAPDQGRTMTSEYDLVCSREWLRSMYQTLVFVGIVVAHIFWGTFSDQYGRYQAQKLCIIISLIFGLVASFSPYYWIFVLSRSINSFSDLGLAMSLSTTMVETVGTRFRGPSVVIVNVGWGLGVMIMPWIVAYFEDFKVVMLFTVMCHILTIPWLMFNGESIRWLLANGKFDEARVEIRRIRKWAIKSRHLTEEMFNQRFNMLIGQYSSYISNVDYIKHESIIKQDNFISSQRTTIEDMKCDEYVTRQYHNENNKQLPNCVEIPGKLDCITKLFQLFRSGRLMIVTVTLTWTIFNSELLYASFIHINLEVGEDVYLNFILGGLMEIFAAFAACLLLAYAPRKFSMVMFWLFISGICFALSLVHVDSTSAIWLLSVAKFAQSTVSSITCLVAYETFPTDLRQTGSGIGATLGMLGAVSAPFVWAAPDDIMGMDRLLLIFSFSALSAGILAAIFIKETKDCELEDRLADDNNETVNLGKPIELLKETNLATLEDDESVNSLPEAYVN